MSLPCLLVSLYVTVTHCIIVTAVIVNTPVCHCQLYNCVIYTECFYHHIMVSLCHSGTAIVSWEPRICLLMCHLCLCVYNDATLGVLCQERCWAPCDKGFGLLGSFLASRVPSVPSSFWCCG